MIIVDDKSKDETCKVVEEFVQKDERIRLIKLEKNAGVSNARNTGLAAAKGKYIAFLDSDDVWLPAKLSHQVAFMEDNGYQLSFTAYNKIDEAGKVVSKKIETPFSINYKQILSHNLIIFSTAMALRSTVADQQFKKVGHEDWLFWMDLLKKCELGYGINEQLAQYRIRSGSISANKFKGMSYTWKLFRESEKLDLFSSCYYFTRYAFNALWKYLK